MLTYTQIKDLDKGARLPIIRGGWDSLKFIVARRRLVARWLLEWAVRWLP